MRAAMETQELEEILANTLDQRGLKLPEGVTFEQTASGRITVTWPVSVSVRPKARMNERDVALCLGMVLVDVLIAIRSVRGRH